VNYFRASSTRNHPGSGVVDLLHHLNGTQFLNDRDDFVFGCMLAQRSCILL
jgi:hypothetical protein